MSKITASEVTSLYSRMNSVRTNITLSESTIPSTIGSAKKILDLGL